MASSRRSFSRPSTNPFANDDDGPGSSGSGRGGGSNPFEDGGGGGRRSGGSSNPFESSGIGGGGGRRSAAPAPNPFDDEDEGNGGGRGGGGPGQTSSGGSSGSGRLGGRPPSSASRSEDSDANSGRRRTTQASSSSNAAPAPATTSSQQNRPSFIGKAGRARTAGDVYDKQTQAFVAGVQDAKGNLASWLKRNKAEDENGGPAPHNDEYAEPRPWEDDDNNKAASSPPRAQDDQPKKRGKSKKGGSKGKARDRDRSRNIQRWPYDNYHIDQERHYEQMKAEAGSGNAGDDGYGSGSDDEQKHAAPMMSDESKFYERPQELPSIKEAVHGLSLVEFEKKAEERAIGIVSTWLFDAGLIDELLVNGAVGPAPAGADAETDGAGALKMDKEIEKLRASAQRELSLINARLNDGVAASGAEVQELVNAVTATKSELGSLRELCTLVSSSSSRGGGAAADGNTRDEFILTRYPRLKAAINARRNLFRCFRELEFFAHIPSTCDRLREELHSGEWTADEWNTIRNVCMEHVELEILLVEAEAGMKAMFDDEVAEQKQAAPASSRKLRQKMRSMKSVRPTRGGAFDSYDMVDKFLSRHVKNVWELGDEIRMRILSGIGSSFDLALNNPAGMVALVEAVEVYERANDQYKNMHEDDVDLRNQRLHFTDMRAAALAQIYQDFELRGLEVFRAIHMQAAETTEDDQGLNSQFTAVLRAATELVAEIELVKSEIAPCFAPHWAIEVLWSACVAHVCSNQIIQQIGGPDGHALPDLTVTQLLDLVAWVEFFRETVEEMFPSIATMHTTQKAADFEEKPDLFAGNGKEVDMDSATDNLAWVNNMLWEVHRLAQEEFLVRTRTQTEEWLSNVYEADHAKNQSHDGKLTTSLCEDVFSLASVQLRTIRERLSKKSDALCMSVCLVFSMMRSKQIHARDGFLQDLETCCAASNDFTRMSEKVEEALQELMDESEFPEDAVATLEASSNELLALYSADAVYAAQSVHIYIFEPIREAIVDELFGAEWEENLTHNELALTLTRTLEDFMGDLEQFIDDFMLKKAVDALISSSVVFYVKCLLETAEKHKSNKEPYFVSNSVALERIAGDINAMRCYFDGLVEDMPALGKIIEKEFEILTTIHELMSIASEISASDASDFILVLHKRIRDLDLTKHAVGDLWHLMNPSQERAVWELVESMEDTLLAIVPHDDSLARQALDRSQVSGLRLDEMMAMHYIESKRRRPVKAGAVEKMVTNWRANWTAEGEEEGMAARQYEG